MNKLLNRWLLGRWETYYGIDQPIKKFEDDFLSRTMRSFDALPLERRVQLTKIALGHEDQACFQQIWQEQFKQILAYSYMMVICNRNTIFEPFVHAYIFDQLQQQNELSWADLTSKSMQYVLPAYRKYLLERFAEKTTNDNLMVTPQMFRYFQGTPPANYKHWEVDLASTEAGMEKKRRDLWKMTLLPYILSANLELNQTFISNVSVKYGHLIKFFEQVPGLSLDGEEPETFSSFETLREFIKKYPFEDSLTKEMQQLVLSKIAERFEETRALVREYPDVNSYLSKIFPKGLREVHIQDIAIVNQIAATQNKV
jgi:hypothetical protein